MTTNADPDNFRSVALNTGAPGSCSDSESTSHQPTGSMDLTELKALCKQILQIAHTYDRNCLQLLGILRELEDVHREIREDLFQPALPDNRQALHALLREIENEGGWPYINRMKIRDFLHRLEESEPSAHATTDHP